MSNPSTCMLLDKPASGMICTSTLHPKLPHQDPKIKVAIAAVNRGDVSQENLSHVKELLRWTGKRFYRVLYLKNGIEKKSAWFISIDRARKALNIVKSKGYRAIIYID